MNINDKAFINKLTSVVPSERQLEWQKLEYYNFIHFGMNTFTGVEWGSGKTPARVFNPTALDTDQWVKTLKESGSRGVILTAKHHDGFCLFPSKFTEYSIKNSPYKNGKGDIVAELAASCKKLDFKLGLYLSPWDRNNAAYGTDEYNDYFCNQLTELCTNYGELFAVWFDGACGEGNNGKKQVYDFPRYFSIIRKLQPNAVISICGPDVRWIGNEGGKSRKSEWSVVPASLASCEYTASISQQDKSGVNEKAFLSTQSDLGSREILADVEELIWHPCEMDVSITKGWFYHPSHVMFTTKSVDELFNIYIKSVGNNSALLLNVPVDKQGLIPQKLAQRLKGLGKKVQDTFASPVKHTSLTEDNDIVLSFPAQYVSKLIIQEDIAKSQRVESFELYADIKGALTKIYSGTTIGWKKICIFSVVHTDKLVLRLTSVRDKAFIASTQLFN